MLSLAYHGELWPELGQWAPEKVGDGEDKSSGMCRDNGIGSGKRKRELDKPSEEGVKEGGFALASGPGSGPGVVFTP
jgi:hypothetical protein